MNHETLKAHPTGRNGRFRFADFLSAISESLSEKKSLKKYKSFLS